MKPLLFGEELPEHPTSSAAAVSRRSVDEAVLRTDPSNLRSRSPQCGHVVSVLFA
jgi:hypothetical protein